MNVCWIHSEILNQGKETVLCPKECKLEENEIFTITILKSQGNFSYAEEQAASKVVHEGNIRSWWKAWKSQICNDIRGSVISQDLFHLNFFLVGQFGRDIYFNLLAILNNTYVFKHLCAKQCGSEQFCNTYNANEILCVQSGSFRGVLIEQSGRHPEYFSGVEQYMTETAAYV